MIHFDDDIPKPAEQTAGTESISADTAADLSTSQMNPAPLPGEPSGSASPVVVPYAQRPEIPDDLRISWSWVHLLCFVVFALVSLLVVQSGFAIYYAPHKPLPQKELEQYLFSIPQFIVGSNVVWFGVVLLFLYVSLAVLPDVPFWRTVGWRKFSPVPTTAKLPTNPWIYLGCGCALSLVAAILGSRVHTPDEMPIEQLMKSRVGSMMMMSMAVLVAPLVEETVFRGYLYPALVRIISSLLRYFAANSARASGISILSGTIVASGILVFLHKGRLAIISGVITLLVLLSFKYAADTYVGQDPGRALRAGVSSSILLTGVLFGIMHGAQLAWTWGIVGLLIFVGITFTYVRARTGTVYASYLMHLGYNGLIAVATILGTHGFTKMPPHP